MPEVQNREAYEQKLRVALATVWKTWTAVSDPTLLNARDLLTLLQQHTYQPLWEVYYLAQHTISQQMRIPTSEQLIAAAFVLYYTQWANDIVARWVSRVSSWILEARIAAHAKQREQQVPGSPQPPPPSTPSPAKRPTTAAPSTPGSSPIAEPVRTEPATPPPVVTEVPGSSPPAKSTTPTESPGQAEPPTKPLSVADEVAAKWKKEKVEVVDDGAIDMYARDGVTSTNSQGELSVVDSARSNGRRIEGIWVIDPSSNWCKQCYELDGTTRDVWGKVVSGGPPLHIKCACSIKYIEVDQDGKPVDYTAWRDRPF